MRPYILSETNLKSVRENPPQLAVLPWGATECHNLHLPYGTDTIAVTRIGEKVCQGAWEQGAKVYLLPTMAFGVNTNMLAFPLVMNMNPTTQLAVLKDVVNNLKSAGVRKLLILNGHGGNDFNPLQRELFDSGVFIAACSWYTVCADVAGRIFEHRGDHADEMETSVGLHLFADLVAPLSQADEGKIRTTRFAAVNEGWVTITRPWDKLTTNSGVGNPYKATSDKGRKYIHAVVEKLTPFVVEFAKAEMDGMFPYVP